MNAIFKAMNEARNKAKNAQKLIIQINECHMPNYIKAVKEMYKIVIARMAFKSNANLPFRYNYKYYLNVPFDVGPVLQLTRAIKILSTRHCKNSMVRFTQ